LFSVVGEREMGERRDCARLKPNSRAPRKSNGNGGARSDLRLSCKRLTGHLGKLG